MRTPASRLGSAPKKILCCGSRKPTTDSTRRVKFTDTSVSIFGWPSRGGVIILSDATHVDFTFLGLSTTNPPPRRRSRSTAAASRGHDKNKLDSGTTSGANDVGGSQPAEGEKEDEDEEDAFCQGLLLLGAKWWDSEKRYQFVDQFAAGMQPFVEDVEEGRVAEPTLRERRWVKVGWEHAAAAANASAGGGGGGFWILDCDTTWMGIIEEDNLVPAGAAKVKLAKTMEERCEILKGMGARFYVGLEDYASESTFLRAWEWKWEGEIGHLKVVRTR